MPKRLAQADNPVAEALRRCSELGFGPLLQRARVLFIAFPPTRGGITQEQITRTVWPGRNKSGGDVTTLCRALLIMGLFAGPDEGPYSWTDFAKQHLTQPLPLAAVPLLKAEFREIIETSAYRVLFENEWAALEKPQVLHIFNREAGGDQKKRVEAWFATRDGFYLESKADSDEGYHRLAEKYLTQPLMIRSHRQSAQKLKHVPDDPTPDLKASTPTPSRSGVPLEQTETPNTTLAEVVRQLSANAGVGRVTVTFTVEPRGETT